MDFAAALRELSCKGRTLISFHSGGDIDAVASALALKELLPRAVVAAPDALHRPALRLLERLGYPMSLLEEVGLQEFDCLILVDGREPIVFGDAARLFSSFRGKKFVVDHHSSSKSFPGFKEFVVDASSCSELIWQLWKSSGKRLPKNVALLLACGIASDSFLFKSATNNSFLAFSDCLQKSGASYGEVISLCSTTPDVSQKLEVLKSLKRATVLKKNKLVIAYSSCNGFEHAVATSLVGSGADVGIAFNASRGVLSCVTSSSSKLHAGKLMAAAGVAMSGSGGGHENSGGASGAPSRTRRGVVAVIEKVLEN